MEKVASLLYIVSAS